MGPEGNRGPAQILDFVFFWKFHLRRLNARCTTLVTHTRLKGIHTSPCVKQSAQKGPNPTSAEFRKNSGKSIRPHRKSCCGAGRQPRACQNLRLVISFLELAFASAQHPLHRACAIGKTQKSPCFTFRQTVNPKGPVSDADRIPTNSHFG